MKKKKLLGALAILTSIVLMGCGAGSVNTQAENNTEDEKLNIVVSIYPLKEYTEKIAGD